MKLPTTLKELLKPPYFGDITFYHKDMLKWDCELTQEFVWFIKNALNEKYERDFGEPWLDPPEKEIENVT